jgi:tellurite resistance protein TehA-like permease
MALMTVGDGTLLLGKDWIGLTPALTVDWVLWIAGTALGLITTVWIPFRMMTTQDISPTAPPPVGSCPSCHRWSPRLPVHC